MKKESKKELSQFFSLLKEKKKLPWKTWNKLSKKFNSIFLYIEKLEKLGVLNFTKEGIELQNEFTMEADLTITRSGRIFATTPQEEEFIIVENKLGAHHRDKVYVEILPFLEKGKFCAKIIEIIRPFAQDFLAKVVSKNIDHYLIKLIDLPDEPFGIMKTKRKIPIDSYVVVEREEKKNSKEQPYQKSLFSYRFLEILHSEDLLSDMKRVALKYQLPLKYPREVIPKRQEIKKREKEGFVEKDRIDLRHLFTCTIDGEDAKDFDDAISLEKTQFGYRLYVHIADVSHFVRPNTPLDKEALKRGNSTYLTQLVLPMLPPILSEEFCSLVPNTDRLAFSCILDFNEKGERLSYEFRKSIIHIHKRYTYTKAQEELEKKLAPMTLFWELAQKLKNLREKSGRIELNIKETENLIDEHGRLKAILEKKRLNSHRIIEEFMLSANQAAAHLARKHNIPMLHRVHESISEDKLEKINAFLKLFGFNVELKNLSYKEIQKALKIVQNSPYESIFHYLLLRSFTQAIYQKESKGHWALAFRDYTHFTSPIRRYSDLVVHRQITAFLRKEPYPHVDSELDFFGRETTRLERLSMEAERAMAKLLAIRFLENHVGKTFKAFLVSFSAQGLFINLNEPMVEGFIPAHTFSQRGEVIAIDDFRIILPKWQKVINIGTELQVRLEKCDWEKIQLVFSIISFKKKK